MSRQVPIITSMAESAEEERRRRTRQYLITMAIRSVCVLLMVFVRGPWLIVVAAGAIFLPWIAVVIANHVRQRKVQPVQRPEEAAVVRFEGQVNADEWYMPKEEAAGEEDAGSDTTTPQKGRPR